MAAAEATGEPGLCSFVTGLRADQDAVTNGYLRSRGSCQSRAMFVQPEFHRSRR